MLRISTNQGPGCPFTPLPQQPLTTTVSVHTCMDVHAHMPVCMCVCVHCIHVFSCAWWLHVGKMWKQPSNEQTSVSLSASTALCCAKVHCKCSSYSNTTQLTLLLFLDNSCWRPDLYKKTALKDCPGKYPTSIFSHSKHWLWKVFLQTSEKSCQQDALIHSFCVHAYGTEWFIKMDIGMKCSICKTEQK